MIDHQIIESKLLFYQINRLIIIIIINVSEEKKENWGKKTITQLRDEIKTFLFAGHETSSTMLTYAIHISLINYKY